MSKVKVGIVGFGFVGRAIARGLYLHTDLKIYDKYNDTFKDTADEVANQDFIFMCLPTPTTSTGYQDLSYMDDGFKIMNDRASDTRIILLKSTVLPGTAREYAHRYPKHHVISNPEFLTERQADLDFINSARILLGGNLRDCLTHCWDTLYKPLFSHTKHFFTSWEGAELAKYVSNAFFATKISFVNEIYDLCAELGVPYNELKSMWLADGRVGNSHHEVPGHDGHRGYGGKCFPKDVKAIVGLGKELGLPMSVLTAVDELNERVRDVKDWKDIPGAEDKSFEEDDNL
jgi:nucleotide sugar dehydrogenase